MKIVTAALAVIATAWGAAGQEAPIAPQPASIEGARTHVYKSIDGIDLRLHVFSPPDHQASMKRPAIVFFFGGGWTGGTVEQFVPQSQHLAERGMVADRGRLSRVRPAQDHSVRGDDRRQVGDSVGAIARTGIGHRPGSIAASGGSSADTSR